MTLPPLLIRIHIVSRQGRTLHLWIPLFLLWLLLLPFALVVLPALFVIFVVLDVEPFSALASTFAVIGSLGGTHVEVDTSNAFLDFHIV